MRCRLRIGISKPGSWFPNIGVYARNLNEADTSKFVRILEEFNKFKNIVVQNIPGAHTHPDGIEFPLGIIFVFTLTVID